VLESVAPLSSDNEIPDSRDPVERTDDVSVANSLEKETISLARNTKPSEARLAMSMICRDRSSIDASSLDGDPRRGGCVIQ
jgi:hypothetical protein